MFFSFPPAARGCGGPEQERFGGEKEGGRKRKLGRDGGGQLQSRGPRQGEREWGGVGRGLVSAAGTAPVAKELAVATPVAG